MEINFKRFLSLALALMMVLSNVPVQAFATDDTVPACDEHDYSITVVDVEATCAEVGSKHLVCSVCGHENDPEEIPALGHTFVEGKCACGEEDPNYTPPETEHQHTWGDVYGSTATCEAEGIGYQACTAEGCTETQEITVAATGHAYVGGKCACGAAETPAEDPTEAPTEPPVADKGPIMKSPAPTDPPTESHVHTYDVNADGDIVCSECHEKMTVQVESIDNDLFSNGKLYKVGTHYLWKASYQDVVTGVEAKEYTATMLISYDDGKKVEHELKYQVKLPNDARATYELYETIIKFAFANKNGEIVITDDATVTGGLHAYTQFENGQFLCPYCGEVDPTGINTAEKLQAALNAGGAVTLSGDIELTAPIGIVEGAATTLDLAGYTISLTGKFPGAGMILNLRKLTIEDSVGGGVIIFNDQCTPADYNQGDTTSVAKTIMNLGELVITGGTITHGGGRCTLIINEFYDEENNTTKTGTVTITGGKFNENVSTFVSEGYECKQENGYWTVAAVAVEPDQKVIINLHVFLGTMEGAVAGTFNGEKVQTLKLEVAPGTTLDLTQYTPVAPSDGYTFRGWYMDPNAADENKKFERFAVTEDHLAANDDGGLYFVTGWTYNGPAPEPEEDAPIVVAPGLENNDTAKELQSNTAVESNKNIDFTGETAKKLTVTLNKVEEGNKLTFDVTPVDDNNNKVSTLNKAITFRLPIPSGFGEYAKVTHKGISKVLEILGNGVNRYIEVESDNFSAFVVEPSEAPVEPITGTITENMVWNDGDIVNGVTISGNVTITVKGKVNVTGTIRLNPDAIRSVTFNGENNAMLIRGSDFAGQMFYAEGVSGNFQNLTFNNITLDGGAVWTGEVDKTLNRGKTNSGIKATGSVLYLVYANADLNNSTLQNHDDSTGNKANAVFLRNYSTIDFNNSVVRNNNSVSSSWRGGVITVRYGGTAKTNNADVYGNSGAAGGFFGIGSSGAYGGVAEVYNSKFHNNYADNGAVFLMQCNSKLGYLKIDGCEFYENASKTAVLTEWAYSRPFIISNSYFHDNECAVWDCHTDPVLDLSGKIVIEEDPDYKKYLFETPLSLGGALTDGSSIAISEASLAKLGGTIIVGNAAYKFTDADMAKISLPEGYQAVIVDITEDNKVNEDGFGDMVAAKPDEGKNELTEITMILKDRLAPEASETGAVYTEITCLPVNPFAYEGLIFDGWVDGNGQDVREQNFTETATLTATWKIETPVVKLGRKVAGENTLVATVTNKYESIAYTYKWYKDGTAIEGATSAEYTISETADYMCEVTASAYDLPPAVGTASGNAEYYKTVVAKIGDEGYETLKAAVEAANTIEGGATVTLMQDITLGEKLTISGNVTISGEYTITRDASYTGTLFTVNAGAALTLDDGLTIDGGNAWVYTKGTPELDMANGAGTYVANHITPAEGGVNATAHLIANNGTLNANKVTIQNSYSTNAVSTISCGASSVTTINGATIQRIAANQSGAVVNVGGADAVLNIKGDTRITGNFGTGNGGIIQNYGQGTTVNMEGGSIDNNHIGKSGTLYASYSGNANKINTFNMSGGIITNNVMEGYGPVYIHTNTVWNMTGGEISKNTSFLPNYVRSKNNAATISGGKIVYNEITGTSYSSGYYATRPDIFLGTNSKITGGAYTQDVTEYLAPDLGLAYDANTGIYTVTDRLAAIGENVYTSVAKAAKAAVDGDTIIVLASYKASETAVIDKNVTLDLNGKNIYGYGTVNPIIRVLADVTVNGNGMIDTANYGDGYCFIVGNSDGVSGNLTIENGTFKGNATAVSVTKGTATLLGGEYIVKPYENSYNYLLNCIDANYKDGSAKIFVKGGVFTNFNPENNAAEGANTNFCAAGYIAEEMPEGNKWTVCEDKNVAQVGEIRYQTLKDAVAAANAIEGGATVIMLKNVTLGEKLTISGNVTISGEHTITRADNYTGTLFNVNAGATLTLDGGLVIDGGNNYAFNMDAYKADLEAMNRIPATEAAKYFTPEEGAPVASAFMITLTKGTSAAAFGGTVNLKNVTIQNNYSTGSGIVSAAQYTETNLNGAKIIHNACTTNSGVAVNASGAGIKVNMYEGTVIDGNHVGGNHGIFKIYSGTVFTMHGGEVTHTTGWNSNGTVVGLYGGTFVMNDGLICSNSSVYGPSNGRNAAIYLHANSVMEMNGGIICHNTGISRGGIDSSQSSSKLTITGGNVLHNNSLAGNSAPDVGGTVGTWTITGGSYTQDVSAWLAPDYGLAYDAATGIYTVTKDIAAIGEVVYTSVAKAAKAAKDGDTITVLASYKASETAVIDKNVTLNLNGKNIYGYGTVNPIIRVLADVTVNGNGMIDTANYGDGYCFIVGSNDGAGNLTIENGTFKGSTTAVSVTKGTATLLDGDFRVKPYENNYNYLLNCIDANYKDGTAKIFVKGGVFTNFNPESNAAEGANTNFCAAGYIAEELPDGNKWTVRYANYVAQVDETKYESLTEAIAAAKAANTTVTVLKTIELTEDGELDLQGVRLNAASSIQNAPVIRVLANITVVNAGIIDGRGPTAGEGGINCYAFIVGNSEKAGTLTITSGTYRGVTSAISITNGTVNISGGTFQTGHDNEGTDYGADYLLNCMDAAYKNGTAKYNITGGKFVGFNPENNAAEGTDTNFLSADYTACDRDGDNKWYVAQKNILVTGTKENGTPYNGELYFTTIYDALDFIQPRDTATIKLLSDFTITADQRMFSNYSIVINAEYITLDLNGKTITFENEGSKQECLAAIAIYNKGTLKIIDSSEKQTGTLYSKTAIQGDKGPRILWITSAGSATIEAGNFISEQGDTMFYTSNSNKDIPTTLYIKGGYFEHTIITDHNTWDYFNQQDNYESQIIELSGGTFKHDPRIGFQNDWEVKIADGYKVVQNDDDTWSVVPAATKVIVTVNDASMIEGNADPAFSYTTDVECPALNINYTVDGTTINAEVAAMEGYEFEVVPGTLTVIEAVARVDSVYYSDLQKAVNTGKIVNLLKDVVLTETLVVELKNTYLKLDGHTISGNLDTLIHVKANGTVSFSAGGNAGYKNTGDVFFVESGNVNIYGDGTITSEKSNCVYVRGGKTTIQKANLVANGEYPAIQGNGMYTGDVTIQGGSISAPNTDIAIYWPQNGKLTVSGGTITGKTALYAKSGSIAISGGEFIATGEKADFAHNSNGATATGDAVVIESCMDAAYETPSVTITGGTFTSDNAEAVMFYDCSEAGNAAEIMEISGGTYTTRPSSTWCAEGYLPVFADAKNKTTWTVKEATAVAAIGDEQYAKIQHAINDAKSGDEIDLIADVENQPIYVDVAITLDLNGHTYKQTQNKQVSVYTKSGAQKYLDVNNYKGDNKGMINVMGGSLTVKDSVGTGMVESTVGNIFAIAKPLTIENGIFKVGTIAKDTTRKAHVIATKNTYTYGTELNINAGEFYTAEGGVPFYLGYAAEDKTDKISIEMAWFSESVQKWIDAKNANGFTYAQSEAKSTAGVDGYLVTVGVLTVDGVWFGSWDDAESSIKKNSTIVLYDDVVNYYGGTVARDFKFPANGGNITLNLNGHTFTSAKSDTSAVTSVSVQYGTVLNIIGGGNIVIENNSYPFVINPNSTVNIEEGIKFTGTMQWNGSGNSGDLYIGETALVGMNGTFKPNEPTRIVMNEAGDWTLSMGSLSMTADNATLENNTLTINNKCSIDLNGHNLTAKNVSVFGTLIDTKDGVGSVKVSENYYYSNHANMDYFPLFDSESDAYRLYKTEVKTRQIKLQDADTLKYWFTVYFNKAEAYKLLADMVADNNLHLSVDWTGSESAIQKDFSAEMLKKFANTAYSQMVDKGKVTTTLTQLVTGASELSVGDYVESEASIKASIGVIITEAVQKYQISK